MVTVMLGSYHYKRISSDCGLSFFLSFFPVDFSTFSYVYCAIFVTMLLLYGPFGDASYNLYTSLWPTG